VGDIGGNEERQPMPPLRRLFDFALILTLAGLPSRAAADPVTFGTRTSFTAAFGSTLVDDFSHSGYRVGDIKNSTDLDIHSDVHMSSVLGETRYQTTGWTDSNIVFAQDEDAKYCGGCNGSFLLTFANTSIGESGGVLGVAFDFANLYDLLLYGATVTIGDGSMRSYPLPFANTGFARDTPGFWGIAAPELIYSIHFGTNLGTTVDDTGSFAIDNLTLGGAPLAPVPEPATLVLVASGIGVAARVRRHRRPGV
jgi:hypothetical protein